MTDRLTTLERAFELAKEGECSGIQDIRAKLKREGYHDIQGQLSGRAIAAQLRQLCEIARGGTIPP